MTIEKAIQTALAFENGIAALYGKAAANADDKKARSVYETLAAEERMHVGFLKRRLDEWRRDGKITPEALATSIPPRSAIDAALRRVRGKARAVKAEPHDDTDVQGLRKALQMELETSGFYRRMVESVPPQGRDLFARFVEIEEGHVAIVQAEIDVLTHMGFWFDVREFDLEAG